MYSEKLLRKLLACPFGPYLEETVLSDRCKFTPTRPLSLEDFQMAYNDEPMGFDRTEFDSDSTPLNVAHLPPIPPGSRVLFRGVLSVHALSHLSDKGLSYLNNDFQQRITRSAVNGQKDVPEAEKYNIRVLVQGYMHLTASFMRSDLAPDGLIFHSANAAKNKFRVYQIISMDIETYSLSRSFLFRHHTLRVMRDILNNQGARVSAQRCTPQWFIDQYLHHYAYPSHSRWQRINYLEGAASSDDDSSHYQIPDDHPPDAQTHRPRHLRRVHKNEVWSIFVSHSEWIMSLVEKHKDLKSKVNTQSWRIFLMQVPQLRKGAILDEDTNGRWGLKDDYNETGNTVTGNASSLPLPVPKVDSSSRSYKKKKKSSFKVVVPVMQTHSIPPSQGTITAPKAEDQLDNIYDSDFTQGSPSPTSYHATTTSWPKSSDTACAPALDPSLYALLPPELFVAPLLPTDMLWQCTIGGICSYVIDMCSPSADNLKIINAVFPQEFTQFLEKGWKGNDEQVYMMFYEMVDAHYKDHLKELDIKHVVRDGDASTFEWIHPQHHRPWPPQKWKLMRASRQQSRVKQESRSPDI
ncbi:hypothetical protein F5148DRAFT_1162695 [Russula earlei]|uniref:Uncharacterized protein n=1 Tax=Russula earlei TaxID=71964 RepID=A0ACC0UND5_9AGAM|nr:hypothetical protein F5148DRAFT_1162695 [Russula earlei]